jgi:molybdopterin converting factor small subunit
MNRELRLTIKLLPPYRKPGETGEYDLELAGGPLSLQQLAEHLSQAWRERLAFAPVDDKGLLTCEFMVNGRHAPPETAPADGDTVTLIPYLCGG